MLLISIVALPASIYLFKKTSPSKFTLAAFFVLILSSIIFLLAYGVIDTLTGNGIDAATIYHLAYGLDGAGFFEYRWLIGITFFTLLFFAIYLFRFLLKINSGNRFNRAATILSFSLLFISLLINPASTDLYKLQTTSLILSKKTDPEAWTSFNEYYRKPSIEKRSVTATAITAMARTSIIQLTISMFGSAPSKSDLNNLVNQFNTGASLSTLANTLDDSVAFKSIYPDLQTNNEFAVKFIDNLIGTETSVVDKAWAVTHVETALNAGSSRGQVMLDIVTLLASSTSSAWANAKAALANQVDIAERYSVEKNTNVTDDAFRIAADKHKNILFIYAESLERTYFDDVAFPGLVGGLRELESKSISFTNIIQAPSTGWTVAGMTASQCGLPLVTPSHGNSMSGMDKFLSSAVCFGDLLKSDGYNLNFMGGANLDFAGKGKLYENHGFSRVEGREELLPKQENPEYKSGWGLYDDSLFAMLYQRFIDLSQKGEKFGLFTLTIDTHAPNGMPSKSCIGKEYKDGSNPVLNSVACSDYLITNFINKIRQSPYADDTLIVLASDHFSMKNSAYDTLLKSDRRNLFMILDPSKTEPMQVNTLGSTLDIGVTLLPFLGYTGEIGLGRDLLDERVSDAEKIFIYRNINNWGQPLSGFWDFPKIEDSLTINISDEIIVMDNREFSIPIFMELDKNLTTTLKFGFNRSADQKSLVQQRKKLADDKYFLLIDKCNSISQLSKVLDGDGFCMSAGKGKKYTKMTKLDNNITYSVNQFRELLDIN